jgi:hypothetical protein
MAKKTVLVSDMSGEEIPDGKGATVRITFRMQERASGNSTSYRQPFGPRRDKADRVAFIYKLEQEDGTRRSRDVSHQQAVRGSSILLTQIRHCMCELRDRQARREVLRRR